MPYVYEALQGYLLALRKTLTDAWHEHINRHLNQITQFLELNNLTIKGLDDINSNISLYVNHTWLFPINWNQSNSTLPSIDYAYFNSTFALDNIISDGRRIMRNFFNLSFQGMCLIIFLLECTRPYKMQ